MKQQNRLALIELMGIIHESPSTLNEQWGNATPLLEELTATVPEGLEGMVTMICAHFNNALKFNDLKVVKFELESGLIKLNRYFQKLNVTQTTLS